MLFSESNTNVSKAYTQAWSNISTPKHNSTVRVQTKSGGSYTFDYTDLSGIFEAIKQMFKEYGLAISQDAYSEIFESKNYVCVETTLLHSSGEWMKSRPLKFLAAPGMQDLGGQVTYMKRYSLSALVGLSTEKDDDANGVSGNSYTHENKEKPKYQQQSNITKPLNAQEAAAIVLPFGKHKGKTLRELFTNEKGYIKWLVEQDSTDESIKEGIELMQAAVAMQNAQQKMNQ